MMEIMRLLSSLFRSRKNLSKEEEQTKEESCNETLRGFREIESCSETFMRFQEKGEDMGIPPSREDQDIRSPIEDEAFSIFKEKAGGDSTVITKAPLASHEEEEVREVSPRREALALLQGVSKNLTYRYCGTIHVQYVPSL